MYQKLILITFNKWSYIRRILRVFNLFLSLKILHLYPFMETSWTNVIVVKIVRRWVQCNSETLKIGEKIINLSRIKFDTKWALLDVSTNSYNCILKIWKNWKKKLYLQRIIWVYFRDKELLTTLLSSKCLRSIFFVKVFFYAIEFEQQFG